MKWLTLFLSVLAMPSLAEKQNITPFPSAMMCAPYNEGERLQDEYGEIPFLEGDAQVLSLQPGQAYGGKIRMFVDPEDYSYTILFDIGNGELSCLLVTGNKLEPIMTGKPL